MIEKYIDEDVIIPFFNEETKIKNVKTLSDGKRMEFRKEVK